MDTYQGYLESLPDDPTRLLGIPHEPTNELPEPTKRSAGGAVGTQEGQELQLHVRYF
jgi:hypothetical protein